MKRFWTQPLPKQIGLAALAALFLHAAIILIQWYVVSPVGFGGTFLLQFVAFLFLPVLVIVLAVPVSVFLIPFRKTRRHGVTILACGPVFVLIAVALLRFAPPVRMNAFQRLADRSEPLVNAIHSFVEKEGRPPADLEELVPEYMPQIPKTGMPAYPTYRYSTETNRWDGNPWVVYVNCTSGGINFDMFMYFPKQNYPERGYGGSLERVGKWAYVHE